MAYARWEKPVQDAAGNLVTSVVCEVRDENADGNPLATLYSDRDGAVPLANPFSSADGVPAFHVVGGCYSVRVYKTGLDQTFRYQAVGTGGERDIAAGSGDVSGPDDSADNEVALYDGLTGKIIKRGGLFSALWASTIHALTAKTTPVDDDEIGIIDSAASNVGKRLTFANLAIWVRTKLGPQINAATAKTTPVDDDEIVIADSAASQATKKVTWANIKATLKTYFDTLYGGKTLLATLNTTSGTTWAVTGISSDYRELYIEVDGVSHNSGASPSLNLAVSSTNGAAYGTGQAVSAGTTSGLLHRGVVHLYNLQSSVAGAVIAEGLLQTSASGGAVTPVVTAIVPNTAAPVSAVQFSFSTGSGDAGAIRVYGVK